LNPPRSGCAPRRCLKKPLREQKAQEDHLRVVRRPAMLAARHQKN